MGKIADKFNETFSFQNKDGKTSNPFITPWLTTKFTGGALKDLIDALKSRTYNAVKSLEDGKVDKNSNEINSKKVFIGNSASIFNGNGSSEAQWLDLGYNVNYNSGYKYIKDGSAFLCEMSFDSSAWYYAAKGEKGKTANLKKLMRLSENKLEISLKNEIKTTSTEAFSVKDATGNEVFGVDTVNGVCNAKMLKLNNRIIKLSSSVMNGAGAGIFALQNEKPQFGKLFAFNKTAPSKFCVYNLYKASADSLPVATLIKNNELEIKAMNGGGTICLNDSSANVEMYCEITIF